MTPPERTYYALTGVRVIADTALPAKTMVVSPDVYDAIVKAQKEELPDEPAA